MVLFSQLVQAFHANWLNRRDLVMLFSYEAEIGIDLCCVQLYL